MQPQRTVGILLFDDVEVLDFAGPYEVFSTADAGTEAGARPFAVSTVSETGALVRARNGLKVQPDCGFGGAPHFDILVAPGGPGVREREMYNETVVAWVRERMGDAEWMTSVCTGAFLLAAAGLLDGRGATTHFASYDRLEREFPAVDVRRNVRFVDEGRIVTSGGVSAGIDMSLHIVGRLLGPEAAQASARRMEYDWRPEPGA